MKKMMMAVGFAMMFAAAGCQLCDEPKPEVYSRSFVGMDKATVMFEWAKAWQELDKPKERDKIGLEVFVDDKAAWSWRGTYVKIPVGASEEAMREVVSATLEEAPFKNSRRWESFDLALADWWMLDLKWECRRLAVSFDENGIVTNQCEIIRTFRDAL